MGKDEITVTTTRLAKEIISNDTVIIGTSFLTKKKKTDQQNFHTYFFGLIVYLFQSES